MMWDEEKIWRTGHNAGYSAAVGDITDKFVEWLKAQEKESFTIEDLEKESKRFISFKQHSARIRGKG